MISFAPRHCRGEQPGEASCAGVDVPPTPTGCATKNSTIGFVQPVTSSR